jgi:signal transduction histidine kinase
MKLSHYISLRFIGAALFISLLSIPIFYLTIEKTMEHNVDESLEELQTWLQPLLQTENIDFINRFDKNISIEEVENRVRSENRFQNKNIYTASDDEFVNYRILDYYRDIDGQNYHINIRKSLIENEDILFNILVLQLGVFLFLLLTLVLINRQLKIKVWNSFYTIIQQIKSYRVDQKEIAQLPSSSITELKDLSFSVENLMKNNLQLFNAQKELTENTSHELQTPLAVFQNKVDLLMQTQPLSEQQMQYMLDLQRTTRKMSQLNKSLLLVSKIENRQFSEVAKLSVNDPILGILHDLEEVLSSKNINVITELQHNKLVTANEVLLQILLNNLISNAVKYCPKDGTVQLYLDENKLQISNTAYAGPLEETTLFQRFKKQNSEKTGNGLGLEIAQKIAQLYGWNLAYQYKNNQHSFELNF